MYGIELIIIIVATIGSALSPNNLSVDMYTIIIIWRLILGLGIGGDYPLSASKYYYKYYKFFYIVSFFFLVTMNNMKVYN